MHITKKNPYYTYLISSYNLAIYKYIYSSLLSSFQIKKARATVKRYSIKPLPPAIAKKAT